LYAEDELPPEFKLYLPIVKNNKEDNVQVTNEMPAANDTNNLLNSEEGADGGVSASEEPITQPTLSENEQMSSSDTPNP